MKRWSVIWRCDRQNSSTERNGCLPTMVQILLLCDGVGRARKGCDGGGVGIGTERPAWHNGRRKCGVRLEVELEGWDTSGWRRAESGKVGSAYDDGTKQSEGVPMGKWEGEQLEDRGLQKGQIYVKVGWSGLLHGENALLEFSKVLLFLQNFPIFLHWNFSSHDVLHPFLL